MNALSGNAIDLAFAWDPTEPVATRPITMQRQGGWNFFYTHDGNKNVSDVVSFQQARGIAAHYEYAPFGAVTAATRNTNITAFDVRSLNPFRFSSEYADDALGLVYYNYRHYEPVTGRWMSRDIVSSHGMYVFCDNSYMDFDILGLYRMISGGFTERYHGSVSARYRLIMEIAYLNSLSCYTIYIYEGEWSKVRLSKEKLKEHGTNHWFGMWGRVNYDIAKRERNSPLVQ